MSTDITFGGTSTAGTTVTISSTTSGVTITKVAVATPRTTGAEPQAASEAENLERAIYGYIQAIRALGRETATSAEIAKALSLPESKVVAVLPTLRRKGVRAA
jgi:hypothetical protein